MGKRIDNLGLDAFAEFEPPKMENIFHYFRVLIKKYVLY